MEVPQSTLGVRTRAAKTLALQKLQKNLVDTSSGSYLQLRSRRLEKQPFGVCETIKKQLQKEKESCKGGSDIMERKTKGMELDARNCEENGGVEAFSSEMQEVSFGENSLEFEAKDRSTRESTPCSFIRNSDTIATPGSTTRRTTTRGGNDLRKFFPTTEEIEEFFACAEQQAQQKFIEKYNFDIVNDVPLPGRYEWEQVVP